MKIRDMNKTALPRMDSPYTLAALTKWGLATWTFGPYRRRFFCTMGMFAGVAALHLTGTRVRLLGHQAAEIVLFCLLFAIAVFAVIAHLIGELLRCLLQRAIPGISQRMLALTLRSLERDGLLTREAFPEVPPRVEYELTSLGKSPLVDWGRTNWDSVKKAQSRFDSKSGRRGRPSECP